MLLAIDIGNTNIVVAIFNEEELIQQWRIHSDAQRTSDEYGSILGNFFRDEHIELKNIHSAVISSVVPSLTGPLIRVCERLIGKKPVIVNPAIFDKLPITIPPTAIHEIGTDLVCNALEAYCQCKKSCIVVDFGTALTFTSIDNAGNIQGVAIAPGIGTAVKSLFRNAAQLPSVPLEAPPNSLGTNTIHSIQAGIILGYKGLVEELIRKIKEDLEQVAQCKKEEILVIATGGLNSILKPLTDIFQIVDKELTLKGLKRITEYVTD